VFEWAGARHRAPASSCQEVTMGRSLLLMLLGIPIPIVLLIWFMGW